MTFNVAFSRSVGAVLVLLGLLALAGTTLAMALASRAALVEERDAKAAFVSRSLAAGRARVGAPAAPAADLAVVAESGTLAAARLDALVRATVVAAGGAVLSSRAEATTEDLVGGRARRIEIQAVMQGRLDALQASLYQLESGRPLVLVEALGLHPAEAGEANRTDPADPLLAATVTLSAYWVPPHA